MQFLKLIDRHWSILRGLDLITDREAEVFAGEERRTGRPLVFEIFEWSDEAAVDRAHTHPDVSAAGHPNCEHARAAAHVEHPRPGREADTLDRFHYSPLRF